MNLKIDKDKCIGCGQCVSICEDVYNFDEDNLATVVENPVKEEHKEDAMSALENCPTGAIEEEYLLFLYPKNNQKEPSKGSLTDYKFHTIFLIFNINIIIQKTKCLFNYRQSQTKDTFNTFFVGSKNVV